VREDVVAGDVAFLIQAIAQAGVALERSAPGAWRRYLDLVLDGLRSQEARPLLRKPPDARAADRGEEADVGGAAPALPPCDRKGPSQAG